MFGNEDFIIGSAVFTTGIDFKGYERGKRLLIRDFSRTGDLLGASLGRSLEQGVLSSTAAFRSESVASMRTLERMRRNLQTSANSSLFGSAQMRAYEQQSQRVGNTAGVSLSSGIEAGMRRAEPRLTRSFDGSLTRALLAADFIKFGARKIIENVMGTLPGQITSLVGGTLQGGGLQESVQLQQEMIATVTTFSSVAGTSYDEASRVIESLNDRLAKSAAALPGVTQDYQQLARSINDNVLDAFKGLDGEVDLQGFEDAVSTISEGFGALTAGTTRDIGNTSLALTRLLGGASTSELRQFAFFEQNPQILNEIQKQLGAIGAESTRDLTQEGRVQLVQYLSENFITDDFKRESERSVDGLLQSLRSRLFDPRQGVFGLQRDLDAGLDGVQSVFSSFNDLLFNVVSQDESDLGLLFRLVDGAQQAGLNIGSPLMGQKRVLDAINAAVIAAKGNVDALFNSQLGQGLIQGFNTTRALIASIVGGISRIGSAGLPVMGQLIGLMTDMGSAALPGLQSMGNALVGLFERLFGIIGGGISQIREIASLTGQIGLPQLALPESLPGSGALQRAGLAINQARTQGEGGDLGSPGSIGANVIDAAGSAAVIARDAIATAFNGARALLPLLLPAIDAATSIGAGIMGGLRGITSSISELVSNNRENITAMGRTLLGVIDQAGPMLGTIGGILGNITRHVGQLILDIGGSQGFKSVVDGVMGGLRGVLGVIEKITENATLTKAAFLGIAGAIGANALKNNLGDLALNILGGRERGAIRGGAIREVLGLGGGAQAAQQQCTKICAGSALGEFTADVLLSDKGIKATGPLSKMKAVIGKITAPLKKLGPLLISYIPGASKLVGVLSAGFAKVSALVTGVLSAGLTTIVATAGLFGAAIGIWVVNVRNYLKHWEDVKLGISFTIDQIRNGLGNALSFVVDKTTSWYERIDGIFGITEKIQGPVDFIRGRITETVDQYVEGAKLLNQWFGLSDKLSTVWEGFKGIIAGVREQLAAAFETAQRITGLQFGRQAQAIQGNQGGGFASPIQGQDLQSVVDYQQTAGQDFDAFRAYRNGYHAGVDFDSRIGGGEGGIVQAVTDGVITEIAPLFDNAEGAGGSYRVIVEGTDSLGQAIEHQFTHLSRRAVQATGLEVGDRVTAGTTLGAVGSTDSVSSGAHLDYKVKVNGQFVDPDEFLQLAGAAGSLTTLDVRSGAQGTTQIGRIGGSDLTSAAAGNLIGGAIARVTGPDNYRPRGGTVGNAERVQADVAGAAAIVETANRLGLDPYEFAALMSWESAGTFNPNVVGGDRNEYKGLIQFSPDNQSRYGTGGQQTIAEQMQAIEQYLLDRGFRPGEMDIRGAYSAVLAGQADERYWDRQDSNGTSVRNAAPKFRAGDHFERGRQFLEDSLGQIAGAAAGAVNTVQGLPPGTVVSDGLPSFMRQPGQTGGQAPALDTSALDLANELQPSQIAARALEEARRQNQVEQARTGQGRELADRDRQITRELRLAEIQSDIADAQRAEDNVTLQLLQREQQILSQGNGITDRILQLNRDLEDLRTARDLKVAEQTAYEANKQAFDDAIARGVNPAATGITQESLRDQETAILAQPDYTRSINELSQIREQLVSLSDVEIDTLNAELLKLADDTARSTDDMIRGIEQLNAQYGLLADSQNQAAAESEIARAYEEQGRLIDAQISGLENLVQQQGLEEQQYIDLTTKLDTLRTARDGLNSSMETAIALSQQQYAAQQQQLNIDAANRISSNARIIAAPRQELLSAQAGAIAQRQPFEANEIQRQLAYENIIADTRERGLQLKQQELELTNQLVQLQARLATAETAGDSQAVNRLQAELQSMESMGLGSIEAIRATTQDQLGALGQTAQYQMDAVIQQFPTAGQRLREEVSGAFSQGMSSGLMGIINGDMSFGEALGGIFQNIFQSVMQRGVENLTNMATGALFGDGENGGGLLGNFGGLFGENSSNNDPALLAAEQAAGTTVNASQQAGNALISGAQQAAAILSSGRGSGASLFGGESSGPVDYAQTLGLGGGPSLQLPGLGGGTAGGGLFSGVEAAADTFTGVFQQGMPEAAGGLGQGLGGILQQLLGGLGGGQGGGAGGLLNGVFSILGGLFYTGGMVPTMAGGGAIAAAMRKERSMSGNKPVLALSRGGPIVLNEGEYVMSAPAVQAVGAGFLDYVNTNRQVPTMAEGGSIGTNTSVPIPNYTAPQTDQAAANDRRRQSFKFEYQKIGDLDVVTRDQLNALESRIAEAPANAATQVYEGLRGSYSTRAALGLG